MTVALWNLFRSDPAPSYTPMGTAVHTFSVAESRFFKQEAELQKQVSCFDVSCWTCLAEVCGESWSKGRGVLVVVRPKQDRWTEADGKDGEEKAWAVAAEESAAEEQVQEEVELKEAASF